jgi:TonB family protein
MNTGLLKRAFMGSIFLLSALPTLFAGDTPNSGIDVLKGRILILRHAYREQNQHYNATGLPQFGTSECSWTVCGAVRVNKIDTRQNAVIMKADRLDAWFDARGYRFSPSGRNVTISIDVLPGAEREQNLQVAMHAVFLDSNDNIASTVPPFWRLYFDCTSNGKKPIEFVRSDDFRARSGVANPADKNVKPPKPLRTPDPTYPDEARHQNIEAKVVLYAVVGVDGGVHDIRVLEPAGFGLDEAAEDCVQKWRFSPCEKDGRPVDCGINVQVAFRFFR